MNVAIVGCGSISSTYVANLVRIFGDAVTVVACCDRNAHKAQLLADEYGIDRWGDVDIALESGDVDTVVNLTQPGGHAGMIERALNAGKHVYTEKPIALTTDEAARLMQLADRKGRVICCAPDTVLGAGLQTAREPIDSGAIGEVISGVGAMMKSPPE